MISASTSVSHNIIKGNLQIITRLSSDKVHYQKFPTETSSVHAEDINLKSRLPVTLANVIITKTNRSM